MRRRRRRERPRAKTLTLAHYSKTNQDIEMKLHMLAEAIFTCIARSIILALIIIELWPFFDFENTDERWRSLSGALV